MAVIVNGVPHPSIADASRFFNVSTRTIKQWIEKGIIPQPPTIDYGTRELQTFTDEYLRSAVVARKAYMQKKKSEKTPKKGKDDISLHDYDDISISDTDLPGDPVTDPR